MSLTSLKYLQKMFIFKTNTIMVGKKPLVLSSPVTVLISLRLLNEIGSYIPDLREGKALVIHCPTELLCINSVNPYVVNHH